MPGIKRIAEEDIGQYVYKHRKKCPKLMSLIAEFQLIDRFLSKKEGETESDSHVVKSLTKESMLPLNPGKGTHHDHLSKKEQSRGSALSVTTQEITHQQTTTKKNKRKEEQKKTDEITEDAICPPTSPATLLALPNDSQKSKALSRDQLEALVNVHVQNFINPHAVGCATNTRAQKGRWACGVVEDFMYSIKFEDFPTNTGAEKMIELEHVLIAVCDEPTAVQYHIQSAEEPGEVDTLKQTEDNGPLFIQSDPQSTSVRRLESSPTMRDQNGVSQKLKARGILKASQTVTQRETGSNDQIPFGVLETVKAHRIPNDLVELSKIVEGLARMLYVLPPSSPQWLDAFGSQNFDLMESMNETGIHSISQNEGTKGKKPHQESLLSRLNIQSPSTGVEHIKNPSTSVPGSLPQVARAEAFSQHLYHVPTAPLTRRNISTLPRDVDVAVDSFPLMTQRQMQVRIQALERENKRQRQDNQMLREGMLALKKALGRSHANEAQLQELKALKTKLEVENQFLRGMVDEDAQTESRIDL